MIQFRLPARSAVAASILLMLGACAAGPQAPEPPSQKEREYVTGSNIPRRDGRAANGVKAMDPADVPSTVPATR